MEKSKVYSLDGNPAVIIDYKEGEPNATALCLTRTETLCTAHMVNAPVAAFEPYKCPEAEELPARVYCENGVCQYKLPETAPFATLSGMCFRCLMKSFEEGSKC